MVAGGSGERVAEVSDGGMSVWCEGGKSEW